MRMAAFLRIFAKQGGGTPKVGEITFIIQGQGGRLCVRVCLFEDFGVKTLGSLGYLGDHFSILKDSRRAAMLDIT